MAKRVAVVGLGKMGNAMAATLIRKGFRVSAWNRSAKDASSLPKKLHMCTELDEVASRSKVILLMLSNSKATTEVLSSLEPVLKKGHIVLDMGSSDPADSKVHAARLRERGIGWVDAPVSGGPEGAEKGKLAVMAGGLKDDRTAVTPILKALGSPVWVGDPGAGHTVKVINQVVVALYIAAVAEGLCLAKASGVSPELVRQAVKNGFADSAVMRIHGGRMVKEDYTPGGSVVNHLKDLGMAKKLAFSCGAVLPHTDLAHENFEELVEEGAGDLDHSALHKLLLAQNNLD